MGVKSCALQMLETISPTYRIMKGHEVKIAKSYNIFSFVYIIIIIIM